MARFDPAFAISLFAHDIITEAKAWLSRYLENVERGEAVVLCRPNVPIAEIRLLSKPPTHERPVGIDRGMTVPGSFFEPPHLHAVPVLRWQRTAPASIHTCLRRLENPAENWGRPYYPVVDRVAELPMEG